MSGVLPGAAHDASLSRSVQLTWLLVLGGFAAMYVPLYWTAANGIWQSDEHGHGALILLVLAWLFWRMRGAIASSATRPAPAWGWPLLFIGLVLYVVGDVVGISIFMFGSQPFVVAGALLLVRGREAVRIAWFALFYFIFMIPLPGVLVDAITNPLKQWISIIVVEGLFDVGYPITRNGVILTIGQYQMLVADACSGLHSMYSLAALGTLFMYLTGRVSKLHNAIMLASILPIAFIANIVRVIVLVLITYHFGDEAGQGFLHGAAGIVLMLVALACLFGLDTLLARVLHEREGTSVLTRPVRSADAATGEPT